MRGYFVIGIAAGLTAAAGGTQVAQAQDYPAKPLRYIVPFGAGGPTDTQARWAAQKLNAAFGQTVIVDNRPAAGGVPGTAAVAKSAPDGYTLLAGNPGPLTVAPAVSTNVPYDTLRDFTPVILIAKSASALVVHPAIPAKNLKEFSALAKSRPGKLNYGTPGVGTVGHLSTEAFAHRTGINVVHVPYKGVPAALGDTIAGRVHYTVGSPVSTLPHVKEGRLRLLAVTTAKRAPALADVPTVAESGVPGYEFTGWMGWLAPKSVTPAIISTVHREAARIVHLPDVKQRFQVDAAESVGSTSAQFAAFLKVEIARWSKVVRDAGIRAE